MGLIIGIIAIIFVIVTGFIIVTYNNLVKSKNKVRNSWAHIDAQLQRRFDLIPNLVEIVKGFVAHEKQLIENVEASRGGYIQAHTNEEKLVANSQLSTYLKSLYTVSENYPKLKSDTNFLKLQNNLAEIEEDISYARQFYNDAVTIYNNKRMTFPNNIIASMFNFGEETLFDAVKEAEVAPKIHFKTQEHTQKSENCVTSNEKIRIVFGNSATQKVGESWSADAQI